jgi:hypothetical protein
MEESFNTLLIDTDQNPSTGWYGYDFISNKQVVKLKDLISL